MSSAESSDWNSFLLNEFDKESDRASALLVGAVLDEILKSFLKTALVPLPNSADDFLDGPSAVINTLGSRIDLVYRMGFISDRLCRDLHLIRKIRDDFAHNIDSTTYETPSIKDRIDLLHTFCSEGVTKNLGSKLFPDSTRGKFLLSASWRLWHLNSLSDDQKMQDAVEPEWGYIYENEDIPASESDSKK